MRPAFLICSVELEHRIVVEDCIEDRGGAFRAPLQVMDHAMVPTAIFAGNDTVPIGILAAFKGPARHGRWPASTISQPLAS